MNAPITHFRERFVEFSGIGEDSAVALHRLIFLNGRKTCAKRYEKPRPYLYAVITPRQNNQDFHHSPRTYAPRFRLQPG